MLNGVAFVLLNSVAFVLLNGVAFVLLNGVGFVTLNISVFNAKRVGCALIPNYRLKLKTCSSACFKS